MPHLLLLLSELGKNLIWIGDRGFGPVDTLIGIEFSFAAVLWRWPKRPAWHFVTLPFDVADEVEDVVAERGGFDSVRVEVRVGASVWLTSMFPSRGNQSLILPVKRQVRDENLLSEGDEATFFVRVL